MAQFYVDLREFSANSANSCPKCGLSGKVIHVDCDKQSLFASCCVLCHMGRKTMKIINDVMRFNDFLFREDENVDQQWWEKFSNSNHHGCFHGRIREYLVQFERMSIKCNSESFILRNILMCIQMKTTQTFSPHDNHSIHSIGKKWCEFYVMCIIKYTNWTFCLMQNEYSEKIFIFPFDNKTSIDRKYRCK